MVSVSKCIQMKFANAIVNKALTLEKAPLRDRTRALLTKLCKTSAYR